MATCHDVCNCRPIARDSISTSPKPPTAASPSCCVLQEHHGVPPCLPLDAASAFGAPFRQCLLPCSSQLSRIVGLYLCLEFYVLALVLDGLLLEDRDRFNLGAEGGTTGLQSLQTKSLGVCAVQLSKEEGFLVAVCSWSSG